MQNYKVRQLNYAENLRPFHCAKRNFVPFVTEVGLVAELFWRNNLAIFGTGYRRF
jgi:hypothetical protein